MILKMKRQWFLNGLLLVCSICFVLFILESGFRIIHAIKQTTTLAEAVKLNIELPKDKPARLGHIIQPSANRKITYELRPNIETAFLKSDIFISINEDGFRSKQPAAASSSLFAIVGIGDSFMFGQGVTEGKQYFEVLQVELDKHYGQDRFQLINMAVPGYNTVMEVEAFAEKGLQYKPNL